MAVVLITGCSSGIGKYAALEMARRGHRSLPRCEIWKVLASSMRMRKTRSYYSSYRNSPARCYRSRARIRFGKASSLMGMAFRLP